MSRFFNRLAIQPDVFIGCLLSLITMIAAIAFVRAATLYPDGSFAIAKGPAAEKVGSYSFEPAAAQVPAPLSGTKRICPDSCDYPTITAAIADIQTQGLGGALTIELASNYVSTGETFPITFTNLTGASAVNTVTLRPASGATNLTITSANTTTTVDLNNAKFVTIDGRAGGVGASKDLGIENTVTAGVALRFINEASNNTVMYAILKGVNTSATSGVVLFSTTTGLSGNDHNTIDNCDIRDSATTPTNAIYALGTAATTTQNNSGNSVSNCNIFNFYAATETDAAGIRLDGGNTDWSVTGNSFYQTTSRAGVGSTNPGIVIIPINVNSGAGGNFTVTNNFVGGSAPNAGGAPWTINGAAARYRFVGIQLNVSVGAPTDVQGNTVKNFSWLSSGLALGPSDSLWTGIYVVTGSVNIGTTAGNTIGSGTDTGSISILKTAASPDGFSFGIVSASNGSVAIANNIIGSIITSGSSSGAAASLTGISVTDRTLNCSPSPVCGTRTISNNTVGSASTANSFNASNSENAGSGGQRVIGIVSSSVGITNIIGNTVANLNNNVASAGTTAQMRGIVTSSGTNTITGNIVHNLSTTSRNTQASTLQSVCGIIQTSTIAPQTVSQNVVYSLSNTATAAAVSITGIYYAGSGLSGGNAIARNLVHSLSVSSTSPSSIVNGLQFAGGAAAVQNNMVRLGVDNSGASTASASLVRGIHDGALSANRNFYHNSVYLGGTQISGAANTFALTSDSPRTFHNNIFFNARSNGGSATGKHYAVSYGFSFSDLSALMSNYNIFFASGAAGVLGSYRGADRITLVAWQSASGQDGSSAIVDPLFVNPTGGAPDLHLQGNNPAEGSGVSTALVTDDFDGETRSSLTPTDVGADAGNFTLSADAFPPSITYPLLSNGTTDSRTLTGFATIKDNVGVSDAPNRPRLYFKKAADADAFVGNTAADNGWKFVAASNDTSPYSFTIDYSIIRGGSVVVGDTVQYFVVAQDAANNLSSNPAGADSAGNPPIQHINAKPGAVNSYTILGAISGTKRVCLSGPPTCDYINLTGTSGVFADINSKAVTGNLTINITGDLNEDGSAGLNQIASNDFPQFSVMIQPDPAGTATMKTISGNVADGLIRLNGADGVTVDGRFNNTGRFLTFRNTNTSNATLTLQNDASNNTIRSSILEGANVSEGIMIFGTVVITGNDNNTITDNMIRDRSDAPGTPFYLIFSFGTNGAFPSSGNVISNNELFNFTVTGILISGFGNESWTIQGNTIYQTALRTSPLRAIDFGSAGSNIISQNNIRDLNTSNSATGMTFSGANNTTVSRNRIYGFTSTGGSFGTLMGIEVGFGASGTLTLVNNQITIIPSFTNEQRIRGIFDDGGSGSSFNAYNNTVLIGGVATGSTSSWASQRGSPPSSMHTLRNNIFFNYRTGGTGNHFAAGDGSTSTSFSSDYNLFVGTGSTGANFMDAGTGPDTSATFATWQSNTGGDAHSLAGNPGGAFTTAMFVNPAIGDLHIVAAGNPLISNAGTPVVSITTDYDNEARSATTPDIGSDEFGPNTVPVAVAPSPAPTTNEDSSVVITLTGTDAEDNDLTFTITNPSHGSLSAVGASNCATVNTCTETVTYTPAANYYGPDSFSFKAGDGNLESNVATVNITINPVADTPSVTNAAASANTQTTSGLVISRNPVDGDEVTHFKITGITGGLLFKNNGASQINNGDFITLGEGNAGLKFTPGTANGSFTSQASLSASDAGLSSLSGGMAVATITVNPTGGVLRFSGGFYHVAEGTGSTTITVERSGDTSRATTVDYASSDHSNPADFLPCTSPGAGFASSRCDFTTAVGTLRFAAGETSKTFNMLITNDNYLEGTETLELTMSNPTGGAVFGVPQTATLSITDDTTEPATNPIDTSSEFVRSQYHDFLNREPDAPGLAFWTYNIEKCNDPARRPAGQTAAECIDKQRESTAVAFFSSPEFQMTGGFVYRLYKGSLTGTQNYDGGSLGRFPTSLEFMRDVSQVSEGIVVNNQISGAVVEANRNRLAAEFVLRPEFVAKYGGLNNTLYVQELFNTTGIAATAAEKQALVDGLTGGTETKASVLRKVVDGTVVISESNVQFTTPYGQAFYEQEFRRVFVYMEYVGYLRRNPDTAGFVFWLGKLNFYNGDPFQAEMVRSFILSPEYRNRFGQP